MAKEWTDRWQRELSRSRAKHCTTLMSDVYKSPREAESSQLVWTASLLFKGRVLYAHAKAARNAPILPLQLGHEPVATVKRQKVLSKQLA